MHSDPNLAHFGADAIIQWITELYFWSKIQQDIREYVKTCNFCQQRGGMKPTKELYSIKVGKPFDQVGIDLVGSLLITTRRN